MLWPPSPASCYFSSMKWLRSSWFSLILGIISIRRSGALAHVTCSKTNWSEVLAHVNTALSVVQFEIGSRFRKWDGRHLNTYRWVFFFNQLNGLLVYAPLRLVPTTVTRSVIAHWGGEKHQRYTHEQSDRNGASIAFYAISFSCCSSASKQKKGNRNSLFSSEKYIAALHVL